MTKQNTDDVTFTFDGDWEMFRRPETNNNLIILTIPLPDVISKVLAAESIDNKILSVFDRNSFDHLSASKRGTPSMPMIVKILHHPLNT